MLMELEVFLNDEPDSTVEDLYDDWSAPGIEMERDTVTIWDGDLVVGYGGIAKINPPDTYSAYGGVRPSHLGRGLGTWLFRTIEERVVEKAGGAGSVRQWIDAKDKAAIDLLGARGYEFVRRFWRMDIPLDRDPDVPRSIDGVTIRGFTKGQDERPAHDAMEIAFKEHWGYTPKTYEEARSSRWDVEWFRADLSLVAVTEEGDIAGVCINGARHGLGFVEDLSVVPDWRGRGIAEALLRTSFRMFRELGLKGASLYVDSDNSTGAMRLYERVGMSSGTCYDIYERRLEG